MPDATSPPAYDAILIVAFGGPEGRADVLPFLQRVLAGKGIPPARLQAVAEHYYLFDGISPINGQMRALMQTLRAELAAHDLALPVYWGNRNWQPFLADTLHQMAADGVRRALAFFTSAYSSYASCRQYLEDIERARQEAGPHAPLVDKLRGYYNHPGFIAPNIAHVAAALEQLPNARRTDARLVFTAHSIPLRMAQGSDYERQLREAAGLVANGVGVPAWDLAYQSRSGPPHQPWLEPDIGDHLADLHTRGVRDVVLAPIGFTSDHMEVIYDLDTEAQQIAADLGMTLIRAKTAGTHPRFVRMIRELVEERLTPHPERLYLGTHGPRPDFCPETCCAYPAMHPPTKEQA